ncbi:MAG: hypothetical protein KDK07_04535, partial [Bauldia sp.]|nr:hypothetical protein [Bauldia sp.]
ADLRSAFASRFAAITKGSFGAKTNGDSARPRPPARSSAEAPAAAASPRPPVLRPPPGGKGGAASRTARNAKPAAADGEKDALESSILAAIAQAVDVLVDDDGNKAKAKPGKAEPEPHEEMADDAAEAGFEDEAGSDAAASAEPEPSPGGDSEDIGDEIQRIIASYSRARQKE